VSDTFVVGGRDDGEIARFELRDTDLSDAPALGPVRETVLAGAELLYGKRARR